MNRAIPPHEKKGNASRAWIFRLALGAVLIGVSVWGIALCREIFHVSVGPGVLPADSSFANLGVWAAWALFFGPLAAAGVAMVWSTLRNMGALDQFAFWLWDHAGRPDALLGSTRQNGGIVPGCETSDSQGLENLTPETVERLQRTGARAATILGGLTGASLLGSGIFGLVYFSFFSRPYADSSVYVALATGRLTIYFALLSAMLVLLGIAVLQHTFYRENNSWLLPLRVFTYMVVRRRQAGGRTRRAGQHLADTKQHPRV